jgi:flagellar protein FlaJ
MRLSDITTKERLKGVALGVLLILSLIAFTAFTALRVRAGFNIGYAMLHPYTIMSLIFLIIFIVTMRVLKSGGRITPYRPIEEYHWMDLDISPDTIYEKYIKLCYKLGRYFDKQPNTVLLRKLSMVGITGVSPGTFIAMEILTPIVGAALVYIVSSILFMFVPHIISPFHIALLAGLIILGMFPLAMHVKTYNKKVSIDNELPYVLAHMSIMAATGATPLKTIENIATSDYGDISAEFRKVLYKTNVQGEDAITALDQLAMITPSLIFRELCLDLANLIHAGGGLKDYLEDKTTYLLERRRRIEKQFADSLAMYAELYVGGIMMLAIMGIIGIITAGAVGISIGDIPISTVFDIFIYGIVPAANGLFLLILELMYLD